MKNIINLLFILIMSMNIRKQGISMLKSVLNNENQCKDIEKKIYEIKNDDETYLWHIYQIVGLLISKTDIKHIYKILKKGLVGWKNPSFNDINLKLEEHDEYIVTPFEVVEGVVQCPKCGGKKTWSMQKQIRSQDEPMTTFSRCVKCDHKWKYSG